MFNIHLDGADVKEVRATAAALQAYADHFEPGEVVLPAVTRLADVVVPIDPTQPVHAGSYDGEVPPVDALEPAGSRKPTPEAELDPPHPPEEQSADTKGVAFDPKYCANAADPFYKSGKRKGQWKKAKGVSEAVYDRWYARSLPETVDTSGAFNQEEVLPEPQGVPQSAGDYMLWISEQMAAGHINQAQVDASYTQAGITVPMLFDTDLEKVAGYVNTLHAILSA